LKERHVFVFAVLNGHIGCSERRVAETNLFTNGLGASLFDELVDFMKNHLVGVFVP
jgi:hypothetical protein